MNQIELVSHAKINLTLEVSAKRDDGYHDIDSVVQIIDIADELVITKADVGVIEVSADAVGVPSGRGNLVYKACAAFFEAVGINAGAKCVLRKNIPSQAGLGGGSGNAAVAIMGLNRIYECGLSDDKLAEIAAGVGSDAPLFVYGGTVRMRGRGELVEPLPDADEMQLVVVKPDVGVSTAWAYAELDKCIDRKINGVSDRVESAVRSHNRDALIANLWNDFDSVVAASVEQVRDVKRLLLEYGAEAAMLAGSGSAVFGVFASNDKACAAVDLMRDTFSKVFATRSLKRSESNKV